MSSIPSQLSPRDSSSCVAATKGKSSIEKEDKKIVRVGWMVIQKKKNDGKRCCFVLFTKPWRRLSFYKQDYEKNNAQKPKGTIELSTVKEITDIVLPHNPTAPSFQIITATSKKPTIIIAESDKQREIWIKLLKKHSENVIQQQDPLAAYYPEGWASTTATTT